MTQRYDLRPSGKSLLRSDIPYLAVIVLVALTLRLDRVDHSLWLDELHTAWTIDAGVNQIAARAQIGNVGPLYFYAVWAATRLMHFDELGLRILSLSAGVALVPLSWWAIRRLTASRAAALLAASLVALDHTCIYYSQNARPYALLQAVALLHVVVFAALVEKPSPWRRATLIVLTVTMFHLHYTSLLLLTGEWAYYAIYLAVAPQSSSYRVRQFVFDLALVAAMCMPALGHLTEIAARRHNWSAFVPRQGIFGVVTLFPLAAYLVWPFLATMLLRLWYWFKPNRVTQVNRSLVSHQTRLLPLFVLLTCWFVVPLLVAWCLTSTDTARLFLRRYTLVSFAALPLATACIWASLSQPKTRALYLLVLLIGVQTTDGVARNVLELGRLSRHGREDWRGAIAWVNQPTLEATSNDAHVRRPVFVRSGLIESDELRGNPSPQLNEYCLMPLGSIYPLTGNHRAVIPLPRTDAGNLDDEQLTLVEQSGGAWFLLRGPPKVIDSITARLFFRLAERNIVAHLVERRFFDRITVLEVVAGGAGTELGTP